MERAPPDVTADSRSLGERLTDVRDVERAAGNPPLEVARARAFATLFAESPQTRTFGRYVVLDRIGAGAMGVVYAAYDPELDRKVALKLLRGGMGRDHSLATQRLVREAQALAKLSHPNVVAVHDAGTLSEPLAADAEPWAPPDTTSSATTMRTSSVVADAAGVVFVAMELVDGDTLRRWLEQTPRSWVEVRDVLVAAGRGLAAAHAVGLVHRDVKPDNVMIGRDGRARVMDFGLVRPLDSMLAVSDDDSRARPDVDALALSMTRAGVAVGTPMYMSPEQLRGGAADAQSDQFSFCVTAWESLFGVRPYDGRTMLELAANILRGEPATATKRRVPTWLRRVLERGLEPDPSHRWPTMEELLVAMTRPRGRRWRFPAAIGLLAIASSLAAWPTAPPGQCDRLHERRVAVWNDEARVRLHGSLTAMGASFVETTAATVERDLDAWMDAWDRERAWACETDGNGTRHDCLAGALARAAGLVDALTDASAEDVRRAVAAAGDLPRPERCRESDVVVRDPAMRERLAALENATALAHHADAMKIARELVDLATASNESATSVRAHLGLGLLLAEVEDYAEAETELSTAFFAAAALGDDGSASEAADALAHLYTFARPQHDDAATWLRHAEAHAHDDDARLATTIAGAHLDYARGRYDAAGLALERALELPGATPAELATVHHDLGLLRHQQARDAEAASHLDRARELFERELGPTHPEVGDVLLARSEVAVSRGDLDLARDAAGRGIAILEEAYGTDHAKVANALAHVADTFPGREHDALAISLLERALAIVERTRGIDHPDTGAVLTDLANRRSKMGAHRQALVESERAARIAEHVFGEHPVFATSLHNYARELQVAGRLDEAIEAWTRAIAMRERLLGVDDPGLLPPLLGLAEAELASGRNAVGIAALERAWRIAALHGEPSHVSGLVAWNLARAIERADPERARMLAMQALRHLRDDPQLRADVSSEIEHWIAERSR